MAKDKRVSIRPRGNADDLIMHWTEEIAALRISIDDNVTNVQIWDQDKNRKIRSVEIPEKIIYWRWISTKKLGIIGKLGVYHYDYTVEDGQPIKMFNRSNALEKCTRIDDYQV